jgi:hypothetical protein
MERTGAPPMASAAPSRAPEGALPTTAMATTGSDPAVAPVSQESDPNRGASGAGTPPGSEAANVDGDAEATPPPDEPSAGFIRRLTHIEYDSTVSDLLGVDGQPSSEFASDVALQGFTNNSAGQNVTPTLAEQYIEAAEDLSRAASSNLIQLLGCEPATLGEEACVEQFITDFGKRAWRRPLSPEEQNRALELFRTVRADYEMDVAVQLVVQYFLMSPQFLYLVEELPEGAAPGSVVPLDSWKVASRLSYFLLGSLPDEALLAAAESGALDTPEAVADEARRLLEQPRARERIGLFFTEWLRLRHIDKLQKDPEMFPEFDLSLGSLLREQIELFAQAVIIDDGGSAADLFTAPFTFVNEQLGTLYDVSGPPGSRLSRVDLDPTQRAGLLTHAALLATLAHQDQTDPVVRGKFVRESILCDIVPPPPVDLVATPPVIAPGTTTRERFSQHQSDPACGGCHVLMDPIGLGFEHYDPIGQWRETEGGLEIDATGEIIGTDVAGTFDGATELSQKLADSEQAMDCMTKTWFRFAMGRSEQEADEGALAVVGERFKAAGFKMSELLVALTETRAFRFQRVLDAQASALEDSSLSAMDVEEETP